MQKETLNQIKKYNKYLGDALHLIEALRLLKVLHLVKALHLVEALYLVEALRLVTALRLVDRYSIRASKTPQGPAGTIEWFNKSF